MSDGPARGAGEGGSGRPRVLVAIAGRQHADQLAAALVEAGADATLIHTRRTVPSAQEILGSRARWWPASAAIEQLAARLLSPARARPIAFSVYRMFDRAVARVLRRRRPDVVIGYENNTLETFRAAKALGITTILDAASVHHRLQAEAGLTDPTNPFQRRMILGKDAEIALADHILTCSVLARDSYVAAGIPPERVHLVRLAFDAGMFTPGPPEDHQGPVRLAFVGRINRVKGADLLADALDALAARALSFECRIAADLGTAEAALRDRLAKHAELLGKLPQEDLPDLYRWADAMVLPSRFDSFGMVVVEALACGLPVIVSDRVGAKDFVEPGVNGLVVPSGDAAALAEALAGHAADPAPLRAMRPAALASVQGADWRDYRRRAAEVVGGILGSRR